MLVAHRLAVLLSASALSLSTLACSGTSEPYGRGPVVDGVDSVAKLETRGLAAGNGGPRAETALRVIVSFHDPDGDAIAKYSFVPRGKPSVFREVPTSDRTSEGNSVELVATTEDLAPGSYAFDLVLRDERGNDGPVHRVAFTLEE